MTTSRHRKLCVAAASAAVGAVLLVNSAWHFRNPFPQMARGEVRELRSSPPQQEIVAEHQGAVSHLRARTAPKEDLRAEHPSRGEAQRTTNPSKLKKPVRDVPPPGNEPVIAPPPPVATVMKPIGYVEKANGQVEAVVSEGDQVYVVHAGEVFAEKYKVTKVSQFAVEVVEVNASHSPVPPPDATNFAAQRAPATPTQTPAACPRVRLDAAMGCQPGSLEAAARREPTSDFGSLGYVEKANGQVQSVVADGEFVRLVPGGPEVAATSNPPTGVASPVEVARVHAEQAPPTSGSETTPAGRPEKVAHPPLPPGSVFQLVTLRSDSPPSDSMEGEEAAPAESLEPSALVAPDHVAGGEEQIAGPEKLETATGRLDSRPPTTETLRTLGYVEWASGQVEGIVAEDNEVFLVKEGDVFADRYRALKVSPTSMVVAEETPRNGSPPSAETVWELDGQFTAGLGFPAGLSPPGDVSPMTPLAQDEQVSAPELGPEPRLPNDVRPPPSRLGHAPRARHHLRGSAKVRAPATVGAGPPAASLPITLPLLGYVQKANGEVQAIVVQDDQIYLIRQGDFFAHRYKAVSVSASAVVAVEVSPPEAAHQVSSDASTKAQLSSAKPVDVTLYPPSEAAQAATLLPEVESAGKALTGSGAGLLEYQPGFGLHFRFSMNATPNLPH